MGGALRAPAPLGGGSGRAGDDDPGAHTRYARTHAPRSSWLPRPRYSAPGSCISRGQERECRKGGRLRWRLGNCTVGCAVSRERHGWLVATRLRALRLAAQLAAKLAAPSATVVQLSEQRFFIFPA